LDIFQYFHNFSPRNISTNSNSTYCNMAETSLPPHRFCADLVELSKHHMAFLRSLHIQGVTLSRPGPESLRRYRDLWLPLVHQRSFEKLIPPADIAWLWHCHRLAPFRYSSYCKKRFGGDGSVEANPPFSVQFEQDSEVLFLGAKDDTTVQDVASRTVDLWTASYPNETFHLSRPRCVDLHDDIESDSDLCLDGFDLLASTDRQAAFLWQVSAPNFSEHSFLEEGLRNYHKFLHLKGKNDPSMVIVPTYQIDLFWHTHMLSSIRGYYSDCKAIIGYEMHHDDSLNDRTEGGRLDVAFAATKAAWMQLYGERYEVEGGMYRGEPPMLYYTPSFVLDSIMMNNLSKMQALPDHPFNKFIGIQGASSTNPSPGSGAYDMETIWCWKETQSQMGSHHPSEVVSADDCWIRYSSEDNDTLESSFQQYGGKYRVTICNGAYEVDFATMKQTKVQTGFEREVKRFVKTTAADGTSTTVETSATASASTSYDVAVATPVVQWTDPRGNAPDGEPGFILPNVRSNRKGVNNNPQKRDYIFGKATCGRGYYHVNTREAYQILEKRIKARKRRIEEDIAYAKCCQCGFSKETPYILQKERELMDLTEYETIVQARAKADIPIGTVGIPATLAGDPRRNDYYTDDGQWLFPYAMYTSGGGCGAIGAHAGGCGGKTCMLTLLCTNWDTNSPFANCWNVRCSGVRWRSVRRRSLRWR
jgi:hypothetical protein